jgi:hypothetical protein
LNILFKNTYLLWAVALFVGAMVILFPYFKFIIDPDGVGYMMVTNRVASGDYFRSINGLWSPLNSWLAVPFVKWGYETLLSFKILNVIFGAGVILLADRVYKKLNVHEFGRIVLSLVTIPILVYMCFAQIAGDLLQVLLLLVFFNVLWYKNYFNSIFFAVFCGLMAGLAYLSKAYTFHFILFSTFLFHFFNAPVTQTVEFKKRLIFYTTLILSMLLFSAFWIYFLHLKYGNWQISNAGNLNIAWSMDSRKIFTPNIKLLIPPPYPDSPSFWEDPYFVQGRFSGPFDSFGNFIKQILRTGQTILVSLRCYSEFSIFSFLVLLTGTYLLIAKQKTIQVLNNHKHAVICMLILNLGYIFIHIEPRYMWLSLFFLMGLGVYYIQELSAYFELSTQKQKLIIVVFALTFAANPIFLTEDLSGVGKSNFEIAEFCAQNKVKGKFISSPHTEDSWIIAYLTKNNYYSNDQKNYTSDELMQEIIRYKIDYYFDFGNNQVNSLLEGRNGIMDTIIQFPQHNFTIYKFHHD